MTFCMLMAECKDGPDLGAGPNTEMTHRKKVWVLWMTLEALHQFLI